MPPPTTTGTRRPQLPPPVWDGLRGAPDPLRDRDDSVGRGLLDVQRGALTAGAVTTPAAPPTLTNPRFTGDRILEQILSGEVDALSSAHDGRARAVGKVQRALVDLGFELPMHEVDGSYGAETEEAIRQFRTVHAPPPDTSLDATALIALDRAAPPPGGTVRRTVDYEQLLADGRLDVTVAAGHSDRAVTRAGARGRREETGQTVEELAVQRFREWLTARGFALELLGFDGEQHWRARKPLTWTAPDGEVRRQEVDVWVRLIAPGTGAAAAFREGLASDEIAIYSGHARYGSGPDFDPKDSSVENFRIGIDRALQAAGRETNVEEARRHGVAVDEENDLVEMVNSGRFDRERYRVWFFNACTSIAYLDEIREEAGGPDRIDVVGTRAPSHFTTDEGGVRLERAERFLEGILAAESVEEITTGLDDVERALMGRPHGRSIYGSSGFGDNPAAPRRPSP